MSWLVARATGSRSNLKRGDAVWMYFWCAPLVWPQAGSMLFRLGPRTPDGAGRRPQEHRGPEDADAVAPDLRGVTVYQRGWGGVCGGAAAARGCLVGAAVAQVGDRELDGLAVHVELDVLEVADIVEIGRAHV